MKILLTATFTNSQDLLNFKKFIDYLQSSGIDVSTLINEEIKQSDTQFTENNVDTSPDLIIAFNQGGLSKAKELNKLHKVPIIYSFFSSNIIDEYNSQWQEFDSLLIINNDNNLNKKIFPKDKTQFLDLPVKLPEQTANNTITESKSIFLDINEESTPTFLLEIALAINNFLKIDFITSYDNNILANLFNSNIRVCKEIKEGQNAGLVIGSGHTIEKAIATKTPCIVVGPRGYGGFISKENLLLQITHKFSGRAGGELNEFIPPNLLMDDIQYFLELRTEQLNKITEENFNLLQSHYTKTKSNFIKSLNIVVENHKKKQTELYESPLICSTLYEMNKIEDGRYLLCKNSSGQYHSVLDADEYDIISQFFEINKAPEVAKQLGYEEHMEDFMAFINQLLDEKILEIV